MLTALKPSLEHDRKHVLLWSRLYGDQGKCDWLLKGKEIKQNGA